jgi:hypothetical protein
MTAGDPETIYRQCPSCKRWKHCKVEPRLGVTTAWQAVCPVCGHTWACRISAADRLADQKRKEQA